MDELSEIRQRYKQFSNHKLMQLWQEQDTLRPEAIPVLKAELVSRGYEEEALKYEASDGEEIDYSKLSLKEIQEVVSERIQRGEYIEGIKADLEDHGVDVLQVFNSEQEKQEGVYEFIASSAHAGVNHDEINEKLKEEYGLDERAIAEVKNEMWTRVGSLALLAGLTGAVRLRPGLAILAGGIALLVKGRSQSKK